MKINRRQLRRLINEVIQEGLTTGGYIDPHDPKVAYTDYNTREVARFPLDPEFVDNFMEYAAMHEIEENLHFKFDGEDLVFMDAQAAQEANEYHFGGALDINPVASGVADISKKMVTSPTGPGRMFMKKLRPDGTAGY